MIFPTVNKIYTVGYEGKTAEEFIKLLLDKDVTHLIDVRSISKSAKDGFSGEELKDSLFGKSIMYVHMPGLGGMVDGDYRNLMERKEWMKAFSELKALAEKGPTVIMCLEKDPAKCHRRYIAEKLEDEGWEVIHIGKGGSWKEKRLDDFAR